MFQPVIFNSIKKQIYNFVKFYIFDIKIYLSCKKSMLLVKKNDYFCNLYELFIKKNDFIRNFDFKKI